MNDTLSNLIMMIGWTTRSFKSNFGSINPKFYFKPSNYTYKVIFYIFTMELHRCDEADTKIATKKLHVTFEKLF